MVAHKIASMIGLRDPTAKGAMVRGIRAADASLNHNNQPASNGKKLGSLTSQKSNGSCHVWETVVGPVLDHWLFALSVTEVEKVYVA